MDFDIEMDDAVLEVAPVPEAHTTDIITGEEQEPGEVDDVDSAQPDGNDTDQNAIVPFKIHIRGLDTFKPDDVNAYVRENYSGEQYQRIEWIDDTSANIIFKSESSALEALLAISSVAIADVTQLPPRECLPAKSFATKPECTLQVRFAVNGDKKVKDAATRSRFYLMNPEFDPETRRRNGGFDRRRYRDREGEYGSDRRRGDRKRYDYDDEEKSFDVNLYDDDADTLAKRTERASRPRRYRSDSVSTRSSESDRLRSQAQRNKDKELFPDRRPNRHTDLFPDRAPRDRQPRDRSASPMRDRDERDSMDLDENSRNMAAMRNREKARAIRERQTREKRNKELFPEKATGTKELFPSKVGSADTQSKAQMDRVDDSTSTILSSAKLADRITPRESNAFSIRGLANKRGIDQGFAIKGNARELFPGKFGEYTGNAGKELFSDKLEGRGRRRQRAEDSFM